MTQSRGQSVRLCLQTLEQRDVPSTLYTQDFESTTRPHLPDDWAFWSSDGFRQHITSGLAAANGTSGLASHGTAQTVSRAWANESFDANIILEGNVRSDTPTAVELLARGQNLSSTKPSYIAASLKPGGVLEIVQVNHGQQTVLGLMTMPPVHQDVWYKLKLTLDGHAIELAVQRQDTNQFLASHGEWQSTEQQAFSVRTTLPPNDGFVGVGRQAGRGGTASFDDIKVSAIEQPEAPPQDGIETFDRTLPDPLPPGWQSWQSDDRSEVVVKKGRSSSPEAALHLSGASSSSSRAWLETQATTDSSITADYYNDNLIPAGVLLRGQNLDSTTPSFYSLTVTRGLTLQLAKTIHGVQTVLGTLRSSGYVSGQWITLQLTANGDSLQAALYRTDTQQWLDRQGSWVSEETVAMTVTDKSLSAAGYSGLDRGARYAGTVIFDNVAIRGEVLPPTDPGDPGNDLPPDSTQKLSHIRLAQLAYSRNPMGSFELQTARDYLDLVIANPSFLNALEQSTPDTPKLIYTNVSNLYLSLLTNWLAYADANNLDRESAFYHVTSPTAYSGMSASAVFVNHFWGIYSSAVGSNQFTDLTTTMRSGKTDNRVLEANQTLNIGWTDRFREINIELASAAANWSGEMEYVSEVNADGTPKTWKTLNVLSNSTNNLRNRGTIVFDPPKDWQAAKLNGTEAHLYYVRLVGQGGTAPRISMITGRDYTNANGATTGTIPVFDYTADSDGDGYLNDAEYARRQAGHDARFVHETRLFYPYYGPMRFVSNASSQPWRDWVVQYHQAFLSQHPHADGLFLDNSNGKLPFSGVPVRESVNNFTTDLATTIQQLNDALPKHLIVSNTIGSFEPGDRIAAASSGVLEEFLLKPNDVNWSSFRDVASIVNSRLNSRDPSPFVILDSHPGSESVSSERTRMGTLAYYYLLADPNHTMLMFFGGHDPSAPWQDVFVPAATYDVGQPVGAYQLFASGVDPQNANLRYEVQGREYDNALVLFKPRSYNLGRGAGTNTNATATTHQLNGNYRVLNSDGSLGPVVDRVTLRNNEGVVLIKA